MVDVRMYKTHAAIWYNKTNRQNISWTGPEVSRKLRLPDFKTIDT